jgi:transposase
MKDGVRARYTLEFKQEAVRLVRGGEKLSAVARTLGVSAQSLDNWVKAEAAGRLRDVRGKALTTEQMEIARLKAELSRVRMERDIVALGRSWSSAGFCRSAPAATTKTDCGKLPMLARIGRLFSRAAGSATRRWRYTSRRSSPR